MDLDLQEQITGVNGPLSGEKIVEVNSINGGCIHLAWKIKLATGQQFFAKTSSREHFPMLEYEASGLTALNKQIDHDYLIIPKPIALQQLETNGILILPWIEFVQGDEKKTGERSCNASSTVVKTSSREFWMGSRWVYWIEPTNYGMEQKLGTMFCRTTVNSSNRNGKKMESKF